MNNEPTLITPLIVYTINEWNQILDECLREIEGSCYKFVLQPGSIIIFHCDKNDNNFEYVEEMGKIGFSFQIDSAILYNIEERSGYTLKAVSDVLAQVEINVFGENTESLLNFIKSLESHSSIPENCR